MRARGVRVLSSVRQPEDRLQLSDADPRPPALTDSRSPTRADRLALTDSR